MKTAAAEADSSGADARFEALARQYSRLIAAAVARVTRGAPAVSREDVQQAVLVSLLKRLRREQGMEMSPSYVYRASIREAVRALRAAVSRAEEPLVEDRLAAGPPGGGPFAAMVGRERREQIDAALQALAPERRRAVTAHLSGFAVDEIMKLHGWTYQRARNLIARGIADLRGALRARGIHG